MKRKPLCLIVIFISIFISGTINAQVTIGSGEKAEDYAILQIDGTEGGIRLPRIADDEAKIRLTQELDENAAGLVIYYMKDNEIQFWNGENWISMLTEKELNESINGITGSSSFVLGGALTQNTTISQPDDNLLFFDVTTGKVTVGDNVFVVDNKGVGIGRAASQAVFDVLSPKEGGKGLRINTGQPTEDLKPGFVLTSDREGYASWQSMTAVPASFDATNWTNTSNINGETAFELATLELDPGMWLISARYIARSDGNSVLPYLKEGSTSGPYSQAGKIKKQQATQQLIHGYYGSGSSRKYASYGNLAWIMFGKQGLGGLEPDSQEFITSIGILPACNGVDVTKSTSTSTSYMRAGTLSAAPQLTYIIEITKKGKYSLYGSLYDQNAGNISIINLGASQSSTSEGYSYFTAIKLSSE